MPRRPAHAILTPLFVRALAQALKDAKVQALKDAEVQGEPVLTLRIRERSKVVEWDERGVRDASGQYLATLQDVRKAYRFPAKARLYMEGKPVFPVSQHTEPLPHDS